MLSKAWRRNKKVSIQKNLLSGRKDGASVIVSHTKSWCHVVFFLTKYISISTACKGMERNNASMLMQSEGKALLSVRQLLLNVMELQTVKICYKGDLWPSLGTLFFQLYVRGMPMLYVHTAFHETFHLHLHHRALHLRRAEMAGSAQPHALPTWLLVHVLAALSLAEVRQEMSWLVSSHFEVVGACRLGLAWLNQRRVSDGRSEGGVALAGNDKSPELQM